MIVQQHYRYKDGFRCGVPIEQTASVMNQLASENRLNAKALVEVSKPENAPLHKYFEWNNDKCGDLWREYQGRTLIAHIEYVPDASERAEPVRAFFQIESDSSNYEPIDLIVQNEDKKQKLYETALRELNAFKKKYKNIVAFAELFSAIDNLPPKAS